MNPNSKAKEGSSTSRAPAAVTPEADLLLQEIDSYGLLRQKLAALPPADEASVEAETGNFHQALRDPALNERLRAVSNRAPEFLSDNAMTNLEQMSPGERLALLALAVRSLEIGPSQVVERYFMTFPSDLQIVSTAFHQARGKHAEYQDEIDLFSVCMPALIECGLVEPESHPLKKAIQQHMEVAKRRSCAVERLMNISDDTLVRHGAVGQHFQEQLTLACRVARYRNDITEPDLAFGGEFASLTPDRKSAVLRDAVGAIHNAIVRQNCHHSIVTSEVVEAHNRRVRDGKGPPFRSAHSTVYDIEHALPIFEGDWRFLMQPMFEPESPNKPVDRYPLQRIMLHTLAQFKGLDPSPEERRKNCECLVEFWHKNRDPLYGADVAAGLSAQDAHYGAAGLLVLIRNSEGYRAHLSSVLYRIEMGRIGISEDGVRYLERSYDLQQHNNPAFFVQRLTAEGEMGIFDEQQRLIKYFSLGDLTSAERHVRPEVLDFTTQTLFYERDDDSLELKTRREQWLGEFRDRYFTAFDRRFLEQTGVHFNNLSFKEQGGYVHFIATADESRVARAHRLIQRHGEAGLRSFISLQFDEALGNDIFALDDKLPREIASQVFQRHAGLVEAIAEIRGFCEEQFRSSPEVTNGMVNAIASDLLKKAKGVLSETVQRTATSSAEEAISAAKEVEQALEGMQKQVVLMSTCFRELARHTQLSYEDVRGCVMHSCPAEQLPEDFKKQIRRIGQEQIPGAYDDREYGNLALSELMEALDHQGNQFHFIRFGPHVIAFCRSHPIEKYQGLYLGSLTTDRHAAGGNFGMDLVGDVVEQLGASHPLVGLVGPRRERLLEYYRQHFGFEPIDSEADGTVVIQRNPTPKASV